MAIGTFYVATVPSKILLNKTTIERRGLTEKEKKNVQRRLNDDRKQEIANYVRRQDSTFPTSVIVAADSNFLHFDSKTSSLILGTEVSTKNGNDPSHYLELQDNETIGLVIDGQHRIEGLKLAHSLYGDSILESFEIPVVFMFDMTLEDMAEVFRTINSKQRPVDPSLIIDLFGLSRKRSPRKLAHVLAVGFNETEGSPFKDGLKMLGKRYKSSEFLSQGSFAKYIISLISKNPDEDEIRLEQGIPLIDDKSLPLRKYFIDKNDKQIKDILWSYFLSVKNNFDVEWETQPNNHLLRKTVGFSALIKVFKQLSLNIDFEKLNNLGSLDYEEKFNTFFNKSKRTLGENAFRVDSYGSSEGEAGRMAKTILESSSI